MCPFRGGELASLHLTQCRLDWYLPPTKWYPDTYSRLATIDMGRKFGDSVPFLGRGAGSPCNTKSPGLRPTSIPSGILMHPAVRSQKKWAKNWGLRSPFWGRRAGSQSSTMWPGRRPMHLHVTCYLNPSSHLAATDMGRKLGACPFRVKLGPHLTQCGQGWGLPVCQVSSWSIQPFGHSTPTSQTWQDRQTDRTMVR